MRRTGRRTRWQPRPGCRSRRSAPQQRRGVLLYGTREYRKCVRIQSGTCQFRKEGSELLEIDSVQTARAPTFTLGRRGRSLITASAVAGISYATAWVVGLAVWPSNLDVAASSLKVLAAYRAHRGAAVTQYALVEGLAAIALAVVVAALGQSSPSRSPQARGSSGGRRSCRGRRLTGRVRIWAAACRPGRS